jgi:predicted ATPase/DNA-binding XRE family transcriptional regulator
MDTFGEWLQQQREHHRLTRKEFASRVGCSVATLRKIESGERRPSAQIAELIANCLGIPPTEQETFVRVARGELRVDRISHLSDPTHPPNIIPAQTTSRNNLPVLPTPLIGRSHDLKELNRLLHDPDCRLLTLVGPGGIGKTRLGIEAASTMQAKFEDGIYFVPLAPVNSSRFIIPVIADSVGFSFQSAGPADPKTQLFSYLSKKQILLLIDNIEHLLKEPDIGLFTELLAMAPKVKLLFTSREPLNLQAEWVYEVQGLPVPNDPQSESVIQGTSVELFIQRARRANAGFVAETDDLSTIAHISQLVDGMPLGIELAASWVRTLSCEEIAREIKGGLDFLHVSARDLPPRHRSMRAVFDHSWKLLSDEEQSVLARLSIFQGGFSRESAEHVAGATLPMLSGLITKSLVRRSDDGRYDLHEVVRQYAADQLAGQPEVKRDVAEYHARYIMKYFSDQDKRLRSSAQQNAIEELSVEKDNVLTAWSWCIAHHEFDLIEKSLLAFETFFDARGWANEGLDYLNSALEALEKNGANQPLVLGHLLSAQSLLLFRLAHIEQAREKLEQGIEILRPLNQPRVLSEALSFLGIVFVMLGKYPQALKSFYEALELAKACDESWFEALNLMEIINIEILAGTAENSYERLQLALDKWRGTGDPRFTAFGLSTFSFSAAKIGRFDEARAALEESMTINESVGDRWGLASALRGLGLIEQEQGRHEESIKAFQQSQSILANLGARWDEARVVTDIGRSLLVLGNLTRAEKTYRKAIWIASEVKGIPLILESILGVAQVRVKQGNPEDAYKMLLVVLNHPATHQETRDRAQELQGIAASRLKPQQVASIQSHVENRSFQSIVDDILTQA